MSSACMYAIMMGACDCAKRATPLSISLITREHPLYILCVYEYSATKWRSENLRKLSSGLKKKEGR